MYRIAVAAALIMSFIISSAFAQYPNVNISSRFSINNSAGDQIEPRVAYGGSSGKYLVVWLQVAGEDDEADIYGQLVNADGTLCGNTIAISVVSGSEQFIERGSGINVAYESTSGRYLVVWQDNRNGPNRIYGQLINSDGSLFGNNFQISPNLPQHYGGSPSLCVNSYNKNFLVVWRGPGSPSNIYGQFVNTNGSLEGAYFQVNDSQEEYYADRPNVAFDNVNNRFLVTWRELGTNQSYGRVINIDGTTYSSEFYVGDGWPTSIVFDSTNARYAAIGLSSESGAQGQLISSSGSLYGSAFDIFEAFGGYCFATADTSINKWLVVDNYLGIIGRYLNFDGTYYGTDFVIEPENTHGPNPPSVAFASDTVGSLVVWSDKNGSTGYDIYGRFVRLGALPDLITTKKQPDNTAVIVNGAIVTASYPGFFYIESPDRVCGIRVNKAGHGLSVGQKVEVAGTINTNEDEERFIDAYWVSSTGTGSIMPLGMPNKLLGGGDWLFNGFGQKGITGAVGLNNIGLLVRTWGRVVDVDSASPISWFKIDDGSGEDVIVEIPEGANISVSEDNIVSVTGISSCRKSNGQIHRLLRIRNSSDINFIIGINYF